MSRSNPRRPRPGDAAPDFTALAGDGRTIRLADFRGRKLVLYFYPLDDTPHCTREACSLRDGMDAIAARGAAVVGVCAQGAASHRAFAARHGLAFPLLADEDRSIGRAHGADRSPRTRRTTRRSTGAPSRPPHC